MHSYVGRFAPSPSGPLHFGSLVCALVSFLHARQANGKWLVRIEDVDTTRVQAGSDQTILSQLAAHGLWWDGDVMYQTARQDAYRAAFESLQHKGLLYACACSRQQIKSLGKYYTGKCRDLQLPFNNLAIRINNQSMQTQFQDMHLGTVLVDPLFCQEDISIKRKDGLFAYNLAVVVDDIAQKVTHIVRGADLIDTTVQQQHVYHLLDAQAPSYFHLPVVCLESGTKLSKQNHASGIDNMLARENLHSALVLIGLEQNSIPTEISVEGLIEWAIQCWSPNLLAKKREILLSGINAV
jgi:glutamyl-Q tRNA(Asp) synthetase